MRGIKTMTQINLVLEIFPGVLIVSLAATAHGSFTAYQAFIV